MSSVSIIVVINNASLLIVFARHRQLCSSFMVYIIYLLTMNVLYAVLKDPLDVASMLVPGGYAVLGENICLLVLYGIFVIRSCSVHSHALITINRIWAVFWPMSYKRHHTVKTAVFFCFSIVVYVHVIAIPGFLTVVFVYPIDTSFGGCNVIRPELAVWNGVCNALLTWIARSRRSLWVSISVEETAEASPKAKYPAECQR